MASLGRALAAVVLALALPALALGAICDAGVWTVDEPTIELVEQEFTEYLSIAKTLAQPLYQSWAEWRNAELERAAGAPPPDCAEHPYSPPCYTAPSGRTRLARPLSGARVVLADYALLRRDFAELEERTDDDVDEWIVANLVLLSGAGAQALGLQRDEVEVLDLAAIEGLYQTSRAAFTAVADEGRRVLAEVVQGYEVTSSAQGLSLIDALRDYVVEKAVEAALYHAGVDAHTVGSYAVVDLGRTALAPAVGEASMMRTRAAKLFRAGMLIRQASRHAPTVGGLATMNRAAGLELTLRRYGLSSGDGWFGVCDWERTALLPRLFPGHHLSSAEVHMAFLPTTLRGDVLSVETVKASDSFAHLLTHWLVPIVRLVSPSPVDFDADNADAADSLAFDVDTWGWDCRDVQDAPDDWVSPFRITVDKLSLAFGELVAPLTAGQPSQLEYDDIVGHVRSKADALLAAVADKFTGGVPRGELLDQIYQRCRNYSYRNTAPFSDPTLLRPADKHVQSDDVL